MLLCLPFLFSCGETKEGCIAGNCEDGYGTYIFLKGPEIGKGKYIGEWKDGRMHGQGTFTYTNLSGSSLSGKYKGTYVGQWRKGLHHGQGTLTNPEGMLTYVDGTVSKEIVYKGLWENGEFVGE